jgi:hypothetical protein
VALALALISSVHRFLMDASGSADGRLATTLLIRQGLLLCISFLGILGGNAAASAA